MKKRLVIYYSLDGNTREAAEKLAAALGADLDAILAEQELPRGKMAKILIGGKQAVFGERPPIAPPQAELSAYEEIILGTPIWAGRCAAPVHTFLTGTDCLDRITSVFTCSGSGNSESCIRRLKTLLPGLRHTLSLYDRASAPAAGNGEKLAAFADEILRDAAREN